MSSDSGNTSSGSSESEGSILYLVDDNVDANLFRSKRYLTRVEGESLPPAKRRKIAQPDTPTTPGFFARKIKNMSPSEETAFIASAKKQLRSAIAESVQMADEDAPRRHTRVLTVPISPKFHAKKKGMPSAYKKSVKKSEKKTIRLSKPQPFHFAIEERLKARKAHKGGDDGMGEEEEPRPFMSVAQIAQEFQKKTPKRFRTVRKHYRPPKSGRQITALHGTKPRPFHFRTDERVGRKEVKPTDAMREEEDMQEIRKQFRARPLDHRILESAGDIGVPRVPRQKPTQPMEFHFRTDERSARIREREKADFEEEPQYEFHARPLPMHVKMGEQRHQKKKQQQQQHLTVPMSPALLTKQRAMLRKKMRKRNADMVESGEEEEESQKRFVFKARPMPVVSPPREVQREVHVTKPSPFHLRTDERGEMYRRELEEQLREEERMEERMRNFQALPMPLYEQSGDDESSVHRHRGSGHVTIPEPFEFPGDSIHERRIRELEEEIAAREEEMRRAAEFHAQPVRYGKPIEIRRGAQPTTEPKEFDLNTERRAQMRAEYDAALLAKMQAAEAMHRQQEIQRLKEEEKVIRQYRKQLQYKAGPIRKFKPIDLHPATKKLTQPKTPMFVRRRALRK